jgi:hypothetical protein
VYATRITKISLFADPYAAEISLENFHNPFGDFLECFPQRLGFEEGFLELIQLLKLIRNNHTLFFKAYFTTRLVIS